MAASNPSTRCTVHRLNGLILVIVYYCESPTNTLETPTVPPKCEHTGKHTLLSIAHGSCKPT
eukprot:1361562-Amorphochlora_amoeboformis.AAC.1